MRPLMAALMGPASSPTICGTCNPVTFVPMPGGHKMNGLDSVILTLVTFVPAAGAVLLLFFPRRDRDIRLFSLVISLLAFVLSLHLPAHFHRDQAGFQYEQNYSWITTPSIRYHMGIDGISLWL